MFIQQSSRTNLPKSRPCKDLHYQQDEEEDSMGLGRCVRPWPRGVGLVEECAKFRILSMKTNSPKGLA